MATNVVDDPWYWTADRVCQELTTTRRSWEPGNLSSPNLEKLLKSLQHHIVNGQVLLTQINHRKDVGDIFEVYVLNYQTWLLEAVRQLRARSPQYLSQYPPPPTQEQVKSADQQFKSFLTQWYRELQEIRFSHSSPYELLNPRFQRHRSLPIALESPAASITVADTIAPQLLLPALPAAAFPNSPQGKSVESIGQNDTNNEDLVGGEQAFDEPATKQLKSNSADLVDVSLPQLEDDSEGQGTGTTDDDSTPIPSPEPSTSLSSEHGADPSNIGGGDRTLVPLPESSIFSSQATQNDLPISQLEGGGPSPAPEPTIVTVTKQPKRLAPGMLMQAGIIDPNRNRAIPTYEDDILGLKVPDSGIAGRKRIAPQLISINEFLNPSRVHRVEDDDDSTQSDVEAANQLHRENSGQGLSFDTPNVSVRHRARPVDPRCARQPRYLGKNMLPVDDLFYEGIFFGMDLPVGSIEADDLYFSHTNRRQLPSGQVRYVGKMMRNFMLSKQDLERTRGPSLPKFSTNLLAVDLLRDVNGEPIPEVFVDLTPFAGMPDTPFVQESESGSLPPVNSEGALKNLQLTPGAITQQGAVLEVTVEVPKSGESEGEGEGDDDNTYTSYTAVRTYHEGDGKTGLMTWRTTPAFTLYYTTADGEVRARRERLIDWPELMGSKDPKDFVALTPLELIGLRSELDYDSLLHHCKKPGEDKVLPVYGQSDFDESQYSSATRREIERERADNRRRRTRQRGTLLTPVEINDVFDRAIEDAVEKWQEVKLPKIKARAPGIWLNSRKSRTKRIQIRAAQNDIQALEARIANVRTQFATISWSSWSQALRGCRNIEPSIFDIEALKWTIATLEEKECPGKPDAPPSKMALQLQEANQVAAQEVADDASDGDAAQQAVDDANGGMAVEEAGDDADDDLGDFIVSDDELDEGSGGEEDEMIDGMEDSEDDLEDDDHPTNSRASIHKSTIDNNQLPPDLDGSVRTPVRKVAKRPSEVIDLTESPPIGPTTANNTGIIDLTTPEKQASSTPKGQKLKLINRSISPLAIASVSEDDLPPLDNPIAIAEYSNKFWEKTDDRARLLMRIIYKLENPQALLRVFKRYTAEQLWERLHSVMIALQRGEEEVNGMKSREFDRLTEIVQLLLMFMDCKYHKWGRDLSRLLLKAVLASKDAWFNNFYDLCLEIDGYLSALRPLDPPSSSPVRKINPLNKHQLGEDNDEDASPTKRRRVRGSTDTGDDSPALFSPHSTRKRPVVEDANAREARARNHERLEEQARRRAILKAKLAESGITLGQGKTKHIINDAAALDQGHVHVNEEIGRSIKQHQIDGVRFMWNQVVAVTNESSMQGCLLAHTMGLGKTMQVITLLVAIAEAASSPDSSISSQIPSRLKGRCRTLVLCPPGLIDNWMDELLSWAPGTTLGDFWKLGSSLPVKRRLGTISDWYDAGGILIVGYEMLRNLVQNKSTTTRQAPLSEEEHEKVLEQLLIGPDIIIADEAHKLKNAKSGLGTAASQFRSKCRIALTGSPLANNVEEYHSMIEFVQPGYLGSAVEFRSKYKEPIEAGLFSDSNAGERRLSLKMLGVLNKELALKVNRADLSVLRNDLPPKKEFVMSVPLTDIQRKVYSLYVQSLKVDDKQLTKDGDVKQATLWSWLATLSLLCNHPYCFNTKMQEGKEAPTKQSSPTTITDDDVAAQLVDIPMSKTGLSTAFVEEVSTLFGTEDLLQVSLSNKVTVLCQILDAAKQAGDKTLVFSSSIPTLDFLEALFRSQGRSLVRLDGKTPMSKRQRLIKNFNGGGDEVFLISTTAGGLGLNLQSANRVVIFDFKYNPIQEEQAVGRAYRIGQLKPTFVYRFVCGGTFEDNIHNKTVFKSQLASRVVDKKSPLAYAKKKFGDFLYEPKDLPQKDLSEFQGMDPEVLDKILASQAQTATIRSIVQTDTFEMDDEDRLTPEEQMEVDRMIKEFEIRRTNPQFQRPNPALIPASPSTTPQTQVPGQFIHSVQDGPLSNVHRPVHPFNGPVQPTTPRPQSTGPVNLGNANQTPILPPRLPNTQRGGWTPDALRSSQAGRPLSPESNSSSRGPNNGGMLPIMGAGTRWVPNATSPYKGFAETQELRPTSDMATKTGNSRDSSSERTAITGSSGGASRPSAQKYSRSFFPILADAYKSGGLTTPTASPKSSQLPENVRKRTLDVADKIKAAVSKNFAFGEDRDRHMATAYNVLRNNPKICRELVDSELSADDFVQGLTDERPGSDHPNSAMFNAMNGQFSHESVPTKTPVHSAHRKNGDRGNAHKVSSGSPGMRDDDAEVMAKVDRNRAAKGAPPVSRPHSDPTKKKKILPAELDALILEQYRIRGLPMPPPFKSTASSSKRK